MQAIDIPLMVYKRNGREISMRIEELSPLKELAFNYVKNTLKEDIKLEDIYSIFIGINWVKVSFNIAKQDINFKLEDLGIEYDKRDEYEKEVYSRSINYVLRLITGEEHDYCKIPNLSSLLKLYSLEDDGFVRRFLNRQLQSFMKTVTGDLSTVDYFTVTEGGVKVVTDMDEETLDSEEYFFPDEILSMPAHEAKERYAEILAKIEQEKKQKRIDALKHSIQLGEKSLAEDKKQLEELEKEYKS